MAGTIARAEESRPRPGTLARVGLAIVGVVLAVAAAVTLGTLYSLVWTGGQPLESLVRDVQLTTAG
ncbi:MAG: hypothetical protein ACRDF9_02460, partial [Candidatus Limnocylindria bacterium]